MDVLYVQMFSHGSIWTEGALNEFIGREYPKMERVYNTVDTNGFPVGSGADEIWMVKPPRPVIKCNGKIVET